eukprot:15480592-Alexandrium_andersonii.AAC.1
MPSIDEEQYKLHADEMRMRKESGEEDLDITKPMQWALQQLVATVVESASQFKHKKPRAG